MKVLSILIPTTPNRKKMLDELLLELYHQIDNANATNLVEILIDEDEGILSVGKKRQMLLERATGKWISFCDSDDWVSPDYISSILKALEENPDVIGFNGYMTHSGERRENFKISKDLSYVTITDAYGNNFYLRYSNHLVPIKRSIAIQIGYLDKSFGEDYCYATRLKESGLLKTETFIEKDLYHYRYVKNK